jgi:AraC-like DNA-binding protein
MTRQHLVAAGIVQVACQLGERYGVPRSELLYVAALEPEELRDPDARVPADALLDIVRYLLERTGDRSLGIRFAEVMDLRTQGFWGYAHISSLTLRNAIDLLLRFQRLRHSAEFEFWIDGDWAVLEYAGETPADVATIGGDAMLASFCFNRLRWLKGTGGAMQAWLPYPEEPHHHELRTLVGGPIVFDAPCNRFQFPACELERQSSGSDAHLAQLAKEQLERHLTQAGVAKILDLTEQVRARVAARLPSDASIARVARDLRLSVRTLRRRLDGMGVSFQGLLEDVRRKRAVEYLTKTSDAVERVAERLGYSDPSNFRRAFRRWTGLPPAAYRAEHKART